MQENINKRIEHKKYHIRDKYYDSVHNWLRYYYGKANKCESNKCLGKSKQFQWAKIQGKVYEKKRKNFKMLCRSCHAKYDCTKETRLLQRQKSFWGNKTHCVRGHQFKEGSYYKTMQNKVFKSRICKECTRIRLIRERFEKNQGKKILERIYVAQMGTNPDIKSMLDWMILDIKQILKKTK